MAADCTALVLKMIERHYGMLIDGAHAGLVGRLDAIEAALESAKGERDGTR